MKLHNFLKSSLLSTPLGTKLAIADEEALYFLDFIDQPNIDRKIEQLTFKAESTIINGRTRAIDLIERELALYFEGSLRKFDTPVRFLGTSFQQKAWHALCTVPYGQTTSYAQEAIAIGKPSASRAVANANGANQIAIVIPCHRIINSNGDFGGYGGGVARKKWLLEHEKKNIL